MCDINTGTIMQFQNEETRREIEKLIGRKLVSLGNLPIKDCPDCKGMGAIYNPVTAKWDPCGCTNPVEYK